MKSGQKLITVLNHMRRGRTISKEAVQDIAEIVREFVIDQDLNSALPYFVMRLDRFGRLYHHEDMSEGK